jgi:hypothetical protein
VCDLYRAHRDKERGLSVVWPQNHWDGFSRFDLKIDVNGFLNLASNPMATVSRFWPQNRAQNRQLWFSDLGIKITASVFRFGPENQVGYDLSVAPQNRQEGAGA